MAMTCDRAEPAVTQVSNCLNKRRYAVPAEDQPTMPPDWLAQARLLQPEWAWLHYHNQRGVLPHIQLPIVIGNMAIGNLTIGSIKDSRGPGFPARGGLGRAKIRVVKCTLRLAVVCLS